MDPVRFFFHGIIFIVYAYALGYDLIYLDIGWEGYGGKFKFLTFLDMVRLIYLRGQNL